LFYVVIPTGNTVAGLQAEVRGIQRRLDGTDKRFDKVDDLLTKLHDGMQRTQADLGQIKTALKIAAIEPPSNDKMAAKSQPTPDAFAAGGWSGVPVQAGAKGVVRDWGTVLFGDTPPSDKNSTIWFYTADPAAAERLKKSIGIEK
jgi:hypothetical protein